MTLSLTIGTPGISEWESIDRSIFLRKREFLLLCQFPMVESDGAVIGSQ